MKEFNTTGVCISEKHYMVDVSDKVEKIKKLVDEGKYFTINRARQYGKTTTLNVLKKELVKNYVVISLDFQGIGQSGFENEASFVQEFCRLIWNRRNVIQNFPEQILQKIDFLRKKENTNRLGDLFDVLTEWCDKSNLPVVLIIDEVDSATNNQVFLDFLAQLREGYISRDTENIATFQSVILAGVTDVKHLKNKIRDEEQHKVNSPWNIASDFNVDMSLSESGVEKMLEEYEQDNETGMDTADMAKQLMAYTNGYPYLVSRLCQLLDTSVTEKLVNKSVVWSRTGLDEAVKLLLLEDNTLFQSLTGKLVNYPELKRAIKSILMEGEKIAYNRQQESIM